MMVWINVQVILVLNNPSAGIGRQSNLRLSDASRKRSNRFSDIFNRGGGL